jgi:hypothetical protein
MQYYHGALFIYGRFISEAIGEQKYQDKNKNMSMATAHEGAKTDCLSRCCKDIGIGGDLWNPNFIKDWKKINTVEVWVTNVSTTKQSVVWRKATDSPIDVWPYKETGIKGNQNTIPPAPKQPDAKKQPPPAQETEKKETTLQRLEKAKAWFKKQNAENFITELIQQLGIDPLNIDKIDQAISEKLFKGLTEAMAAIEKSKKQQSPAPAQPTPAPTPKAEPIDPIKDAAKLIHNQTAWANYIAEARGFIPNFEKFIESKFGTGAKVLTLTYNQKAALIGLIERAKIK